jgi:predicted ATPase
MHFARGRDMARAVRYLHSAGEQALQRSVHREAIVHFTHALARLPTLPETLERTEQELQVHMALGLALIATKGYADPDVEHTYSRARELCQQMGETPHLFPVLFGLWLFHLVRGELQTARHEAQEFLRLVNRPQAPALFLEAHGLLGITLIYLGECAMARRHLEQSLALYNPAQHRSLAFLYGQDHGVACLSYAAWVLWLLGYPDQALQRSQEALSLAQELSHPFSRALALNFAALLRLHRREGQAAQAQAETLIALSVEHGFAMYSAHGTILRGGALAMQGQEETGRAQMLQGLEALQATGAVLRRPYYLAVLAEVYGRLQQTREGLTQLTAALEVVDKNAERIHEAELYRLKGELLLQQWQDAGFVEEEAEACFLKALEVARHQQARSWELRAVISLGRLWQRQARRTEARQLLATVYGWFTEGFDTADLQEAKGLLEELS